MSSRHWLPLLFVGLVLTIFPACQIYQPAISDLRVGTSVYSKTKEVLEPQDTLPANTDIIYASVYLHNAPAGTRLRATWQRAGQALAEPTEIDATGTRFVAFSVPRPIENFRSGSYGVTVEIIGHGQSLTQNFQVR